MVLVLLCLQSVGVKVGACRPMDGLLEIDTTFARTSVQIVRSEHNFPAVLGQILAEKCARGKISIDFFKLSFRLQTLERCNCVGHCSATTTVRRGCVNQ